MSLLYRDGKVVAEVGHSFKFSVRLVLIQWCVYEQVLEQSTRSGVNHVSQDRRYCTQAAKGGLVEVAEESVPKVSLAPFGLEQRVLEP